MLHLIENMNVEELAMNGHIPKKDAMYIIVNLDGSFCSICAEDLDKEMIIKDYFSRIININKSVDRKKQILSNNKYTIFSNKLENITQEILVDYYNALECAKQEQKKYINWFLQNRDKLLKFSKKQIKVFFPATLEDYKTEGRKYFKSRIFADSKNAEIYNGMETGAPITINTNHKKPFLLSNPTKSRFPVVYTKEDCYRIKCLLDIFGNYLRTGYDKVYLENGAFTPVKYGCILSQQSFGAVFISFNFNDRGEVIITDWQSIPYFCAVFNNKNIVYYFRKIDSLFFDGNLYNILANGISQKAENAQAAKMLIDRLREWFILGKSPDEYSIEYISKWLRQIIKNNLDHNDYDLCISCLYFLKELEGHTAEAIENC